MLVSSKYFESTPCKVENYSVNENCFFNVQKKVKKNNGKIIYGWKIYQTSILLEAERHAIWESENNEKIDITPDATKSNEILFLEEDNGWTYKNEYVDNVRINITKNPLVDDYILLCETITKLYQTGKRLSQTSITLDSRILNLIQIFEKDKILRERYIYEEKSRENKCYCGQPMKYKDCHGLDLPNIFHQVINQAKIITNK